MDVRTIETRLRELAGGADMISLKAIRAYTGTDYDWIHKRFKAAGIAGIGNTTGKRYHIRDVAKALS